MSKFSIIKRDQETLLQSEIFPHKKGVGFISMSEFEHLVEQNFGDKLEKLVIDKYVDKNFKGQKGNNRNPASEVRRDKNDGDESVPIIWFVLGLGVLGFVSTLLVRGKGNEN